MNKINIQVESVILQQLCDRVPRKMKLEKYLENILESWIADHPICPECKWPINDNGRCNCKAKESIMTTGCVFVGKLEHGDCLPVNQNLPKKIFDYALEMARAIQQGREIENKLLTDVFDSEEK